MKTYEGVEGNPTHS